MPNPSSGGRAILVINAGSSSIKFALFACPHVVAGMPAPSDLPRSPFSSGEITGIGEAPSIRRCGSPSLRISRTVVRLSFHGDCGALR